ncbi:glycogen debranching protein GlgX [Propionimicrobium sp. PCR01-08-3]|uniref:glycogen debranching protein GlgX n=1 Tax=Propionimicrobium sp. PCR01-08-3 TaxID=3052086 RepID=UPI00255CF6C1|nr:glycogen debranching protein GlgX [Propionimicrobium sp. PCR01-08-3]WIY83837.1 glycogen debranching protein GlgX [Propionimicrobium sp. PCR01-08-3]
MPTDASGAPGAHLTSRGCVFRLPAPRAKAVELVLLDPEMNQRTFPMSVLDGIWYTRVPGVGPGQRYGYRVYGEWNPAAGLRDNPAKLLVDPYARAITSGVDYAGPVRDHLPNAGFEIDQRDSSCAVPLSVVVNETPPPPPVAERRPMSDSVIYEAHVKGLTRLHPEVPEHLRGSYAGVAYPAVIDHLTRLGVTALELLPVHHFISESAITARGKTNYWGYSTLGFFAPHAGYCSVGTTGEQVDEFKSMVAALHRAGIEVILDVVYNHTCEGGVDGPTLSFRGIDHRDYYRLHSDLSTDYDVTGCGNSLDTSKPAVLALVLDSMRYWVTEMGVDGFRFDLATALIRDSHHHVDQDHPFKRVIADDPVFDGIKLIAEPWDMGPYGYQVGRFGRGWSEWNDRYRGFMRDYWRGAAGVQELATRLTGSADLFDGSDRPPSASVNFITAHDGFTMRDLVSFNHKHNRANGERNCDGSDDNRSWNCGAEGETDDPEINALRQRQVRNLMATLLLSRGVPMITAGDEWGRTQLGNNNAYCQDNPISWMDWKTAEEWSSLTELTVKLSELRASSQLLHYDDYLYRNEILDSHGQSLQRFNLVWMNGYSGEMQTHDWQDDGRRLLGMYLSSRTEAMLVWFYSGTHPIQVTMPGMPWGWSYQLICSTAETGELPAGPLAPGDAMTLPGRTVAVMTVKVPSDATALRRATRRGKSTR